MEGMEGLITDTNWIIAIATIIIDLATVVNTIYIAWNIVKDNPKIVVSTSLHDQILNSSIYEKNKTYTTITIANIVRRPVYRDIRLCIYTRELCQVGYSMAKR